MAKDYAYVPLAVLRSREVPQYAKLVYGRLRTLANRENKVTVALNALANDCAMCRRHATHAIRKLEAAGLVTTTYSATRQCSAATYTICDLDEVFRKDDSSSKIAETLAVEQSGQAEPVAGTS